MTEKINNFNSIITNTNSTNVEMLSTNQFIELPLIASYSNAFLETIAEETSELETSENGTFNNDIFDMDKISFCTDNDIKICDIDLSNQLSGLKQDNNNNNNNDNNSNNNQISLDNFENLNEYLSKNFISSSNTLYKVKQTEFSSDNLENNQQPSTKLKLFQQQLYNSWTLNLPVKLDDKKEINSFEDQLYTDLGNSTNSGLTKNGFLKDVNNNNNNSTSQYTNSVNTDGFVELTEDSKENHKKIINTIKQNKSQKEFTLPLWNDEAIDEELLILSTDYNRNQLCWTLTPSYATMNSSLSQCKTNEDVKILIDKKTDQYPIVYESNYIKYAPNVIGIPPENNFTPDNMNTVKQTVHSKGNLSSTFLPYNTVQNTNRICQVATDNSLMSQFVNNDNQLMTNFDNNLVFSHTPKQIFTSDFQSLPEKYYNKLSDTFIETSRNQGSSSSFVPHTIQMEHSTSLQKLSNTDCIPSYCDYSMEMFNPNYSSINFFNDFKDNYEHKDQQNRSCNGSYSLTDTSKCQLDPIISVKGLSDNSNTSNHKNQFTASNICCNPQMNNFHVSQRNYPTNISTFKPVSKDFSYTLSAAHKDFNYSISIIPENDSLKCTLKEPNNSNTNSCYFESNCTLSLQGKKNKDWKDSLPPVLFEMNSNFNENEQIQPTTYHHVKSPDLYSTDYLTNFSYSQIGNHSMLDNNEVVKSKIQLSEAQPMGFSRYRNDDDIFCQNSEINYMKYEEKHSIPVSSQQQKTYPNSYNTTFNLKNNSSFRPLQRSPAVVGVSDLLIKSDAELNSILEKIKSVSNSNHPKLESHELLKQKCSFDSSPDKSTSNGGLSSNPYQDDVSPARRRFFPHYLTHDVKLNYSTGISHQDSDDMEEEKRSFYDYGCDDEEDEDKMEDEDELYLCNDNMDKGNQKFHTNYSLFNSKYSTHNKNAYNNNASVIQRIRELELQNQVYHWEDNCIHSTDKSCSKGTTRNINNNIKNSSNNKNTNNKNFSTINEVENEDDEDERKMLSTYECEDNDMPFIDSDSFILEFSHLKGLLPRIADLEEITLSSRRSSDGGSPWLGLSQIDNTRFDNDQSTCELLQNTIEQEKSGHIQIRRRRDYHSYDSSTQCRNKRKQKMWFQKLCGCVRASRSH